MIPRSEIVGDRIAEILGDTSVSDDSLNFCDFVYRTDGGVCFRMPFDDESGDPLPEVSPGSHTPVAWPRQRWWRLRRNLWTAEIADILVPADADERFPDTGAMALTSGWFVVQLSAAPIGILPAVDIVPRLADDRPMISVWSAR